MNRIEFMTQLAVLLQGISQEERKDAMQYYNDYFDDAGELNEQQVITELGSPQKVTDTIKANLGGMDMDAHHDGKNASESKNQDNKVLKILLIIAIVVFGIPVIIPIAITVITVLFAVVVTVLALFATLVSIAVALVIAGVVTFVIGVINLVPALAIGIALMGVGLVLAVVGIVSLVASVKLCIVAFPAMFKWSVALCRRPFQGRVVA